MTYLEDKNLKFLFRLRDSDLEILHNILLFDNKFNKRISESLTDKEIYKHNYPHHSKYVDHLIAEFQTFGGNTFLNQFRGHGVKYVEILIDVCDKLDINIQSRNSISKIENTLLLKILEKSYNSSSFEERKHIFNFFGLEYTKQLYGHAGILALQTLINSNGFAAYKAAAIIANSLAKSVGLTIPFAGNAAIMKGISAFVGPIGVAINSLFFANALAGPAYRVTIPATIHIAFLRKSYNQGQCGKFIPRYCNIAKQKIINLFKRNTLQIPQ